MSLSWNEIKERAISFAKEWEGTSNEEADAKPFLQAFFNVFGISSKRVASFEHRVKKLDERDGYIDLLWKGNILIEMKSRGKNLDKAYQQARDYMHGLSEYELPKYILISDFEHFRLYDLEEESLHEFKLNQLIENIELFGFIAGYQKRIIKEEDPVNIKAAYLMGKLHDALKEAGYTGHELERYLVRLLFCLFADDTTIFETGIFQDYIQNKTHEDGSDLGLHLAQLFQVLNTPDDKRQKTLDESLAAFPYINGQLFEEQLLFASFNSKMRNILLECCTLDWSKISPAIFGSMFQSVMNPVERRNLGAHYTSEKNILKLIKPLFIDELWNEFETIKSNKNKLKAFHNKIANLHFLDPACGCGNFLVITYRELRYLELSVLKELQKGQQVLEVESLILCNVDKFYGIEHEEFPAQIAQLALWLIDHQMNMIISKEFGQYFTRIPLKKSASIVHGNALQIEWADLLRSKTLDITANHAHIIVNEPPSDYTNINIKTKSVTIIDERKTDVIKYEVNNKFDFIIGNPPFIGKQMKTETQKKDLENVFAAYKGVGVLDYVAAWYLKAAKLIQGSSAKAAFVSTNSIVQGEQTGILWNILFNHYKIKIHFAHQTFQWNNEAKANAAVHCVIIGFANYDVTDKSIFVYDDIKADAKEVKVKNINPYLIEAKDILILKRRTPLCDVPAITFGNMPNDGGNFFIEDEYMELYKLMEGISEKYIKPFYGAYEFLNGKKKWCLWFYKNLDPKDYNFMSESLKRIKAVEKLRQESTRESTRKLALFPSLFGEIRQPDSDYILIPRVSSENRRIIPMAIFTPDNIVGDTCLAIPKSTIYHLGVLQSKMHMTWVNYVCGRLKSDYRYSNEIVYNNYPWPENVNNKQKEAIEAATQKVLDVRALFPESSLADLYGTLMPPELVKAHNELDKLVDLAYRKQAFISDSGRMEFLFGLYEKYSAGLIVN